jgi:hypothetical protein
LRYMHILSPFVCTVENICLQMLEDMNFVLFAMFQKCFGLQRSEHRPESEGSGRSDSVRVFI